MTDAAEKLGWSPDRSAVVRWTAVLAVAGRAAGPPLLFGLRLWASVCLALFVAYRLQLDNPYWAGTSASIVCLPEVGASLRKSWFRMVGTLIGAVMSVVLTACCPQDRVLFLGALAVWGAASALTATLLRNFAAYSAALAGYTVAIIGGELLGAVGGPDANAAFLLAVTRATEICIGIACAGLVLLATDLGGAQRRLASVIAGISTGIMAGFTTTLGPSGPAPFDTQAARRDLIGRVGALDPLIDVTLGESSEFRYHQPVLQRTVDGLLSALASWRAVANHLARRSSDRVRHEAASLLETLPPELRSSPTEDALQRWMADPSDAHRMCDAAVRRLIALPAGTPSLRLLADETAMMLAGIADALNGLALLAGVPARPALRPRGVVRLRVPDWLPALVNAGRAFATIGAVGLFWIVTGWPGGTGAIIFATIAVILLELRGDQAYAAAMLFMVGILLDVVITAIVSFAVLPGLGTENFVAFSLVIGLCLIPIGALLKQARLPWQIGMMTAMTMTFIPFLRPTNPMTYDDLHFYNEASSIVVGNCAAALAFRLLPPIPPRTRTRRLLSLTLRDLRRLAQGRMRSDWEDHVHSRLSVMPASATPLQRAQLLAALSAGSEIIRLRRFAQSLALGADLGRILAAIVGGRSAPAVADLARLDAALALRFDQLQEAQYALRMRSSILALSENLTEHADYFDAGGSQ